jgi:hypothetical protein
MREKYRGLIAASVFLRVAAVVVVVVGVGFSLWGLISSDLSWWSRVAGVLGICISLLTGVVVYSFAEVINLLIDIENEMRDKIRGKE